MISRTHSLYGFLSRYRREEGGRRYGLDFLQTPFKRLARRSTAALDTRGDHTNTINCKRRTLVQSVIRVNLRIEHGKEGRTATIESGGRSDITRKEREREKGAHFEQLPSFCLGDDISCYNWVYHISLNNKKRWIG